MNKTVKLGLGIAGLALLATPMVYSIVTPPLGVRNDGTDFKTIHWRKDYETAVAEARQQKRPVLVEFTAEWCGPCKQMAGTTLQDPRVIQTVNHYVPVHVDVDKRHDLAVKHQASVLPITVLLTSTGETIGEVPGMRMPEQYRSMLERGLELARVR